jgi:hypothetical protein
MLNDEKLVDILVDLKKECEAHEATNELVCFQREPCDRKVVRKRLSRSF